MSIIGQLRLRGKKTFDRIRNEKLKHNLLQAIPFWIASLLTGLAAVLYTNLFAWAERGASYIRHWHLWLFFIVTPVCFVAAWWLVKVTVAICPLPLLAREVRVIPESAVVE